MRIPKKRPEWKCKRHTRYFSKLYDATPKWLSDEQKKQYYRIYAEAKRQRSMGNKVEVDHIVPLLHPLVCGLNVPWNLRIVSVNVNQRKSNNYWPDMPNQTLDLFPELGREEVQPHQLKLSIH